MMDNAPIPSQLPDALLPWYRNAHRDLPWRRTREPYPVWLSEIMLQQTRVEAVKGYFSAFLEALPTLEALAACPDDQLNKLWEGLGYYSRARNLKKAAQVIVQNHAGRFPTQYEAVLALPGIGEYTAGAICSICFDLPTPAVDGNVLRLLARLTDDPTPIDQAAVKRRFRQSLAQIYPRDAGDFTQALIELGATLCGPNQPPDCLRCPCKDFCLGHLHGTAQALPVRSAKREKRHEDKTVFILSCNGLYALEKRPSAGLLAGLWQFPNTAGHLTVSQALDWVRSQGLHPKDILREVSRNHIFTHICWKMKGLYLEVAQCGGSFTWFTPEQIRSQAALPTAFRQFWEEIQDV